ncbi:MAG: transporter [Firmicutes bacterium]|nr:transporter [Bacillota bacterium]
MKEGRTKNTARNFTAEALNQIIQVLLDFAARTVFIHTLGSAFLGINGLYANILDWLSVADLGINTAMMYSFYKPLAEGDNAKLSALVNYYRRIYYAIAAAVFAAGLALMPFLNVIINLEEEIPYVHLYYFVFLVGTASSYMFVHLTTLITANQQNSVISKIAIRLNIIRTVLQIAGLIILRNYLIYIIIFVVFKAANNVVAAFKAKKMFPDLDRTAVLSKDEKGSIFKNLKSVVIYKTSSIAMNATDNVLISKIIGTVIVGLYSNYVMLTNKLSAFVNIIFSSVSASIGNLIVTESNEKKYDVFECMQTIGFVVCGVISICFCVIVNDFINVWLGADYILDNLTIAAVTLNLYLSCVLQPLWTYRETTALYLKTKYVMAAAAVINIALSIVLGKLIGLSGILFASAISRLVTYVWYEPILLFKTYFSRSPKRYFISIIANFLLLCAMIIIGGATMARWAVSGWIGLILKACVCFAAVCAVYLAIYGRSRGMRLLYKKFGALLKR